MEWIDEIFNDTPQEKPKASLWLLSSIDSLIAGASITQEEKERLEKTDFESMDLEEVYKVVNYLKDRQLDPIAYGFNYSQTDIIKHLKKLL